MEVAKCFLLQFGVLIALTLMACSSHGYIFYVGGRDGWALNPSESYSLWAARNRFQVNDTLVFNYKREENSVLRVVKEDYDACNVENPLVKMDGGDSVFMFDRSGPFYFISGVPDNCDKGQKLPVVVMAVRNTRPSIPPAADQTPSTPPVNSSASSPFWAPSPRAQTPSNSSSGTGTRRAPPQSGSVAHSSSSSSGLIASSVALVLAMGMVLGVFLN